MTKRRHDQVMSYILARRRRGTETICATSDRILKEAKAQGSITKYTNCDIYLYTNRAAVLAGAGLQRAGGMTTPTTGRSPSPHQ